MENVDLPVKIKTSKLTKARLEVYYPQVIKLKDRSVQKEINGQIQNKVKELIKDQDYYENHQMKITGSYEIKTNERGILSLSIINYAYCGGAHGFTVIKSLTVDTATGKEYTLEDLFRENSNYKSRLSKLIGRQIIDRNMVLINEFNGVKEDQDYYLADKCLLIYFQLYELTPYSEGFPFFPISIYEIEDIVNKQGPLGKMFYRY